MEIHTQPMPSAELQRRSPIKFCHPGYPSLNVLLYLPRVDSTPDGVFGVYRATALLACQIIANNAFKKGYLAEDVEGQKPVRPETTEILTRDVYFFRIEGGPDRYPVVPSFQDWQFPHDHIQELWPEVPEHWQASFRCAISHFSFPVDKCHLVPKDEYLWFLRNSMDQYGRGAIDGIHVATNIVTLRPDLHRCFDRRLFAIVPKATGKATGVATQQYVTYILSGEASDFWPTFHNTTVQYLDPASRAYLFARFAWAILLKVKAFLAAGIPRQVIRVHIDPTNKIEYKAVCLEGAALQNLYGGGGSMSASARKKRSRQESAADSEESVCDFDWMEDITIPPGARSRRMNMSSETTVRDDIEYQQLEDLRKELQQVLPQLDTGYDSPDEEAAGAI